MDNETSTGTPDAPIVSDNVHFDKPMKDVAADIEARLYGSDEKEPTETKAEEVSEDDDLPLEDDDLPKEDDTEDKDEGSEEELKDIAEMSLADYLGIDDERIVEGDDGSLLFNAIIDGESKQVPLSELAANFQLQSHVNNKSIALENERKEFEDTRNNVATELQQRVQGIQALHKMAEEQLVSDFNQVDWDKLRVEDPGNWTALRQEYAEKAQKIQDAQGLATQEQQRMASEQQQQFQTQMQDHMKDQFSQMITKNPKWADEAVLKTDMDGLKTFVSNTYGYDTKDFDNVSDHRLIELIKDAKSFREGTKAAEGKKVKRVPKFTKPGAARGNAASLTKARNVKARRAAVKEGGGKTSDVANLLLDRM
jgi:hypothetical protein